MKKRTIIALAAVAAGTILGVGWVSPAQATDTATIVKGTCPNLAAWPDREDEVFPAITADGLVFGDKTNIHHPIAALDLADVRAGSFTASGPADDQLLMKLETDTPYATIVVTADGKFWSSKIPAGDPGGQSHPVDTAVDLVGLAALPGKTLTASTHVVTVGVGVGNGDGAGRLVSSVTFHGHTYDLTCHPASPSPSTSTSHTAAPTTKPTVRPTSPSTSHAAAVGGHTTDPTGGGALAITGINAWQVAAAGVGLLAFGGAVFLALRRRRWTFEA